MGSTVNLVSLFTLETIKLNALLFKRSRQILEMFQPPTLVQ